MSLILGILAQGVAGAGAANSYESIATVTVGSGGSSTITFSSIPSTYTHLQLRYIAKGTTAEWVKVSFNNDTTNANYATHRLLGDGANAYAEYGTGTAARDNFTLYQNWGSGVMDILDYANTSKYKTSRHLAGWDGNGSGEIRLISNLYMSTTAISRIDIVSINFVQYSQFALYGIKGS